MTQHLSSSCDIKQHILETAETLVSRKGFTAVGLNEILKESNVPKGSFYHYFPSKEAFGVTLINYHYDKYLTAMDQALNREDLNYKERVLLHYSEWQDTLLTDRLRRRSLGVMFATEVAESSESMRLVLMAGGNKVRKRLTDAIEQGVIDGSIVIRHPANQVAYQIYQAWLGAVLVARIQRTSEPLANAMMTTRDALGAQSR